MPAAPHLAKDLAMMKLKKYILLTHSISGWFPASGSCKNLPWTMVNKPKGLKIPKTKVNVYNSTKHASPNAFHFYCLWKPKACTGLLSILNVLRSPEFVAFRCYLFITMYLHRTICRKALSRSKCFLKSFQNVTKSRIVPKNCDLLVFNNCQQLVQFPDQLDAVVDWIFLLALSECPM